jgi:hypothetical protein
MLKILKQAITLITLSLVAFGGFAQPADAQLVVVEDTFRIVDVDKAENRIAIANPSADPDVRQNWLYIEDSTRGAVRNYVSDGLFQDEVLTSTWEILEAAENREGQLFKVNGGRDFDGSIDANKIWL